VRANAAKAHVDLAARLDQMEKTPAIQAQAIELARQIDDAEARKVSNLEKQMSDADGTLVRLTAAVAEARASLEAFEAKPK
jgi:uncharacterized coiled-coil protein SlyX